MTSCGFYLFDLILDGKLDPAQTGPAVLAGHILVHISIQNGFYFFSVSAEVQHPDHKVLTLHRQLPVVILQAKHRITPFTSTQYIHLATTKLNIFK